MSSGERPPAAPLAPAARERVVELLSRSFANDEITEADLEARLSRVYQVTTLAELEALTADLKTLGAVPETRPVAARRITAMFSGQERRITGVVPRDLRVRARLGYVELDLSQAHFEPGITEIDIRALIGYVEIRLPAGVRVESDGRALFGYFASPGERGRATQQAASVVRVTGRAILGYAECSIV